MQHRRRAVRGRLAKAALPKQLTHLNVDVKTAAWRPDSGALALIADSHQRDEYSYERAGPLDRRFARTDPPPDRRRIRIRISRLVAGRKKSGVPPQPGLESDPSSPPEAWRRCRYLSHAGGWRSMKNLTPDFDLIPDAPHMDGDSNLLPVRSGRRRCICSAWPRRAAAGANDQGRAIVWRLQLFGTFRSHRIRRAGSHASRRGIRGQNRWQRRDTGETHGEIKLSRFNDRFLSEVDLNPAERHSFPEQRRNTHRRLDREAASRNGSLSADSQHPRRPAHGLRQRVRLRNSVALERIRRALHESARVHRIRRKIPVGHLERLGQARFQDVMAGVDYAVAHYPVDPKRLGVTGYSYGGFLDQLGDHADHALQSRGGGRWHFQLAERLWHSRYSAHQGKRILRRAMEPGCGRTLRALSPITYAGNVKTPTLFVHGESDMRVPIEEGEQMYTALRKQHVAAKFIRYPGQLPRRLASLGHGPSLLSGDGLVQAAPEVIRGSRGALPYFPTRCCTSKLLPCSSWFSLQIFSIISQPGASWATSCTLQVLE